VDLSSRPERLLATAGACSSLGLSFQVAAQATHPNAPLRSLLLQRLNESAESTAELIGAVKLQPDGEAVASVGLEGRRSFKTTPLTSEARSPGHRLEDTGAIWCDDASPRSFFNPSFQLQSDAEAMRWGF
jgi:hypothetical protein